MYLVKDLDFYGICIGLLKYYLYSPFFKPLPQTDSATDLMFLRSNNVMV